MNSVKFPESRLIYMKIKGGKGKEGKGKKGREKKKKKTPGASSSNSN